MTDGLPEFAPITAAVNSTHDEGSKISAAKMKCYECNEPNHLARNCLVHRNQWGEQGSWPQKCNMYCFQCNEWGHVVCSCSRKQVQRHPCLFSASKCGFACDQCASVLHAVFSSHRYGMFPLYSHNKLVSDLEQETCGDQDNQQHVLCTLWSCSSFNLHIGR